MKHQKKKLINAATSVLFLGVAVWAIYSIFSSDDFDYERTKKILLSSSIMMVTFIFIDSVVGHYLRALRWKLLLKASDYDIKTPTLWWTMMYGYMINLGVPRLGEVSRCMSLQKKEKVPFTTSFSTVVIERVTDVLILFTLVGIVSVWQYDRYEDYINDTILGTIFSWKDKLLEKPLLMVGIGAAGIALLYFMFFDKKLDDKVNESPFINEMETGLKSITKLEKPWLYILLTFGIWVSYFLTGFFCFKAVPGLEGLGVSAMFAVLAFGFIARSLPMFAGGAGVYHVAVVIILAVGYGIDKEAGTAAGTILHGVQTFMQALFGVIALYFLFGKKSKAELEEEEENITHTNPNNDIKIEKI